MKSRHTCFRNIRRLPFNSYLGKLDVEVFVGGFSKDIKDWPTHKFSEDPYWRLYLPVEGAFRMVYPDSIFTVKPGGLYLIPPQKPFQYESISPCSHYWVHFMSEQLKACYPLGRATELPVDLEQETMDFNAIMDRLKTCNTMEDVLELKLAVTKKLLPFLKQYLNNDITKIRQELFSEVLDYIDRNLEKEIMVRELSVRIGVSRTELSAMFHNAFKISPKRYILTCRITRAKMLLLRTSLTIKEIAAQVGYDNEFFFYRIFKKYTKLTPHTFRERNFLD